MPENTELERSIKYAELYTLNHDFVSTAKNYAQTIISEFFLHKKDKSIHAKKMGGIAGGEVRYFSIRFFEYFNLFLMNFLTNFLMKQ